MATVSAVSVSAETLRVVADITPVHSLVTRVMQGTGSAELLIEAGQSPHDFALRPSTANALQDADVVFWIGHALTPQLEEKLDTLAGSAKIVELADIEGGVALPFREEAVFEKDADHDHDHDHHEGLDPHMWLDPENAKLWIGLISETLTEADPENGGAYAANAQAAIAEIDTLILDVSDLLRAVKESDFVVFHDAYQYFENRFDLSSSGSILIADGTAPSAKRLKELQQEILDSGVTCVFSEPQFDPRIIQAISSNGVKTAELDPMGVSLEAGPDLYPTMIHNLATSVAACLAD